VKAIINGRIILENKVLDKSILIFNEKFQNIINEMDDDYEIIDAKGNYVSPGFIDVHVHGAMGYDTMDADLEGLKIIGKKVLENGVTSYLPTTMTMSDEEIHKAFDTVRKFMNDKDYIGAEPLGIHVEGPFINVLKKGAQNEKYIQKPNLDLIKDYMDIIKIITYAPEMDEDNRFLKEINKYKDVNLSMGHSNATFEEAMDAIENGAASFTHLFNAMTGLHHRNPGMIGASFKSNVYSELIADTIHVNKGLFQTLMDIKKDKLLLITDGMSAKCMEPGDYELGGQKVAVNENSARLEDGTLAGSILKLNEAIKNVYKNVKNPINEVVNMASIYPARMINEDKTIGSIEIGKNADICIFDENIDIKMTFKNGERVF